VTLSGFEISRSARRELVGILAASFERFGEAASHRYEALVQQAIQDLVDDPDRPGTQLSGARIHYHLRHSRKRVTGGRVREPRHILVCKIQGQTLYILAVGHDAMEEGLVRRIEEGQGS
jgi:toxin ParE1/3/4